MATVRPLLIGAQTLVLVWAVAAAFGPVPRLLPALAVSAGWFVWRWARGRWPRRADQVLGMSLGLMLVLARWRPDWAAGLGSLLDVAVAQWQELAAQWRVRGPVGYGVTTVPLFTLATVYENILRGHEGDSRAALNAAVFGMTVLFVAAQYRDLPIVLWGGIVYVVLALALAAYMRAEELTFARYRGDVRGPLLGWAAAIAVVLFVAVSVVPGAGPLHGAGRQQARPPADWQEIRDIRSSGGLQWIEPEPQPPAASYVGTAEPHGYSRWLALYLVLIVAAAAVPALVLHRWARRRAAAMENDAVARPDTAWPDLPRGPWAEVVVKAFVWLLSRLTGRNLRPGLTASEYVALLTAQRPALAAPLERMLGKFLPARYGAGQTEEMRPGAEAVAQLERDWQAVRQHLAEEALQQGVPGWVGRMRLAWHRLRQRGQR